MSGDDLSSARQLCRELTDTLDSAVDADEMRYVCSRLRMAIFWAGGVSRVTSM